MTIINKKASVSNTSKKRGNKEKAKKKRLTVISVESLDIFRKSGFNELEYVIGAISW